MSGWVDGWRKKILDTAKKKDNSKSEVEKGTMSAMGTVPGRNATTCTEDASFPPYMDDEDDDDEEEEHAMGCCDR